MHCASCAKLIERKLKKTPGIVNAAANYGSESASVNFDPNTTSLPLIRAAVSDIGYKAIISTDTMSDNTNNEVVKSPDQIKEESKMQELADMRLKVIISGILFLYL